MNRRGFLKFAAAAPVAVPMIGQAAAQAMQPQPIFGEAILGETAVFEPLRAAADVFPSPHADLIRRMNDGIMSRNQARVALGLVPEIEPDPSVTAQMLEHDLFDDSGSAAP